MRILTFILLLAGAIGVLVDSVIRLSTGHALKPELPLELLVMALVFAVIVSWRPE